MATHIYPEPVSKLLTYGEQDYRQRNERWPDYLELGLTEEHVSDLIEMATDMELNRSSGESTEIWAPLHAWRALGQPGAEQAAEHLVRLFDLLKDDDWVNDELPKVFAMIGPAAIPILAAFLDDADIAETSRLSVPECLGQIGQRHPATREDCIAVLVRQLEEFRTNGSTLNGFLVCGLIDLRAISAMDTIRKAYLEDRVDLSVNGDIEDVEIEMGLREYRTTPAPRYVRFDGLFGLLNSIGRKSPVRDGPKVGRNEPCPCGSGKKFKKCCLN